MHKRHDTVSPPAVLHRVSCHAAKGVGGGGGDTNAQPSVVMTAHL